MHKIYPIARKLRLLQAKEKHPLHRGCFSLAVLINCTSIGKSALRTAAITACKSSRLFAVTRT